MDKSEAKDYIGKCEHGNILAGVSKLAGTKSVAKHVADMIRSGLTVEVTDFEAHPPKVGCEECRSISQAAKAPLFATRSTGGGG